MDAEPGGGDLRGVTRDSSMDLASHHWSIWTDLKSGRRRSGAEISAGSVEAAGRFRDVSYCSVDLPTLETARFSKSFSTVPHHHYPPVACLLTSFLSRVSIDQSIAVIDAGLDLVVP